MVLVNHYQAVSIKLTLLQSASLTEMVAVVHQVHLAQLAEDGLDVRNTVRR
jgi:hypothetical protein